MIENQLHENANKNIIYKYSGLMLHIKHLTISHCRHTMKILIHKDCDLVIIVHSLRQVYFDKNIVNLLVQLVSPTSC
jgi:hypothetical protein